MAQLILKDESARLEELIKKTQKIKGHHMQIFSHDEEGYSEWIKNNPQGFIMNYSVGQCVIHCSSCLHLAEDKDHQLERTTYTKNVSNDLADLVTHVIAEKEKWHFCDTCSPQKPK